MSYNNKKDLNDVLGSGNDSGTYSINIKTPTWSDYNGFELEFVVSYVINN